MILEKFLGNSSKKVTTVGESGEIPHFCYLGINWKPFLFTKNLLRFLDPWMKIHISINQTYGYSWFISFLKFADFCTHKQCTVYSMCSTFVHYSTHDLNDLSIISLIVVVGTWKVNFSINSSEKATYVRTLYNFLFGLC